MLIQPFEGVVAFKIMSYSRQDDEMLLALLSDWHEGVHWHDKIMGMRDES